MHRRLLSMQSPALFERPQSVVERLPVHFDAVVLVEARRPRREGVGRSSPVRFLRLRGGRRGPDPR
jgi:hypothetical protein